MPLNNYGSLLKHDRIPGVTKLIARAKDYPCQCCGKVGFTVAAHSNALEHGRGASFKTPDFAIAYLCGDAGGCHDLVDGRSGGLSLEVKREMWLGAHAKTVAIWFVDRLIVVT